MLTICVVPIHSSTIMPVFDVLIVRYAVYVKIELPKCLKVWLEFNGKSQPEGLFAFWIVVLMTWTMECQRA